MKWLEADQSRLVVEFTAEERGLVDSLFVMVDCMESPDWRATEAGYGRPELDQQKFDRLYDAWQAVRREGR